MSEPAVVANFNGRIQPAGQAAISPLDRGFLYGDSVYEVWRSAYGALFAWDEHWARLRSSADAIGIDLPWGADRLLQEIRATTRQFRESMGHTGDLYVRLQISRGAGPIGLDPDLADRPNFLILVQALRTPAAAAIANGAKVSLASTLRRNDRATLNPAWKTGNYLNNLLCLREARRRRADEVLMLNLAGEITEAAVCNIAFVAEDTVVTPPLESGLLAGITRQLLLTRIAPMAGIRVLEERLTPSDLDRMTECFLLSTTRDVHPVASLDTRSFRTGSDTVAMQLKQTFDRLMRSNAHERPDLAV